MTKPAVVRVSLLLMVGLALAAPARAIVVCHDYTLYRLTGKDPRPKGSPGKQGSGVKTLRDYLSEKNYKPFPMSNAAATNKAMVQRILKPGDVIIIRDDHSGFVNAAGKIDHFIQVEGTSRLDVKYDAHALPLNADLKGKKGGLYVNETFAEFLSRVHSQVNLTVEVWRKR